MRALPTHLAAHARRAPRPRAALSGGTMIRPPVRIARTAIIVASLTAWSTGQAQLSGNTGQVPLPTGQLITPDALPGAFQQPLNPGLSAYPNFVAGEAVKSQLSPDGTTLAI